MGHRRMGKTKALDLAQIGTGERFELFCSELLKSMGFNIARAPSRGPDRGVDIIATSSTTDDLGFELDVRMAVECKHFAGSQRSVTEAAVGNIVERTLSHNCNRYLLITSTIPSSSLAHQIEGINNNPSIPLRANAWSAADIERLVQKYPLVVERFSPVAGCERVHPKTEEATNQTNCRGDATYRCPSASRFSR